MWFSLVLVSLDWVQHCVQESVGQQECFGMESDWGARNRELHNISGLTCTKCSLHNKMVYHHYLSVHYWSGMYGKYP